MITVDDVLKVFAGAKVVEIRGRCEHCAGTHIPAWRRGGKLVEVVLADGTRRWQCHYCGRVADLITKHAPGRGGETNET
jgi:hypothetical protein